MPAISRPPSRRKISSGSDKCPAWKASAEFDDGVFAREAGVVEAGSAPGPAARRAAIERGVDRRGGRGVAYAHLARREQIDPAVRRLHAIEQRAGGLALLHRGAFGEVAGRMVQRQLEDFEADRIAFADLIDGRAAGGEIIQHLARDGGRKGGDALGRDAVISREDGDERPLDPRLGAALPGGEPFDDLLEPAERPRRLGELGVAPPHGVDAVAAGGGEIGEKKADVVEGRAHAAWGDAWRGREFKRGRGTQSDRVTVSSS